MSADIRVIFFDAAGTLFSLREPVGAAYAKIAARHGIAAEPEALDAAFRQSWKSLPAPLHPENAPPADDDRSWWREIVRRTFAEVNAEPSGEAQLDALFDDLYAHFAHGDAWLLHDDVRPALEELRATRRLFVLSNFDRRLRSILSELDIAEFFEDMILSSEAGASKPHERMFRIALAKANVTAAECLHVGDEAKADRDGALQAGMRSFLVERPQTTLRHLSQKLRAE